MEASSMSRATMLALAWASKASRACLSGAGGSPAGAAALLCLRCRSLSARRSRPSR